MYGLWKKNFFMAGVFVLLFISEARGDVVKGYIEAGERSTAEDYDEEDGDDDYIYRKYHLKFDQEMSERLSYSISSFVNNKDYKVKDSWDNVTKMLKTDWSYYLRKLKEESLELGFGLKYKEKQYKNSRQNEYRQFSASQGFTYEKKDLYAVKLAWGLDDFDYPADGEKDEVRLSGRAGFDRHLGEKILFVSSYKAEESQHKKRDHRKTKHDVSGGVDYLNALPWISKFMTRARWGQGDTKDEDDRDTDADYEYWNYYAKTEHELLRRLKTSIKYQYFKKDYMALDLGHNGFYVRNAWDYEILNDEKKRAWCGFEIEHKDVNYVQKSSCDYLKETLKLELNYQKKKDWKTKAEIARSLYSNDKERYFYIVSAEKFFLNGDLALILDLKYKYTLYNEKFDAAHESARLSFNYRF